MAETPRNVPPENQSPYGPGGTSKREKTKGFRIGKKEKKSTTPESGADVALEQSEQMDVQEGNPDVADDGLDAQKAAKLDSETLKQKRAEADAIIADAEKQAAVEVKVDAKEGVAIAADMRAGVAQTQKAAESRMPQDEAGKLSKVQGALRDSMFAVLATVAIFTAACGGKSERQVELEYATAQANENAKNASLKETEIKKKAREDNDKVLAAEAADRDKQEKANKAAEGVKEKAKEATEKAFEPALKLAEGNAAKAEKTAEDAVKRIEEIEDKAGKVNLGRIEREAREGGKQDFTEAAEDLISRLGDELRNEGIVLLDLTKLSAETDKATRPIPESSKHAPDALAAREKAKAAKDSVQLALPKAQLKVARVLAVLLPAREKALTEAQAEYANLKLVELPQDRKAKIDGALKDLRPLREMVAKSKRYPNQWWSLTDQDRKDADELVKMDRADDIKSKTKRPNGYYENQLRKVYNEREKKNLAKAEEEIRSLEGEVARAYYGVDAAAVRRDTAARQKVIAAAVRRDEAYRASRFVR